MTMPRLAAYQHRGYCADAAVHLLRGREASYPALVTDGKMTAEHAKAGLEIMRVLVAQWQWVMHPARPALPDWDYRTGYFGCYNHLLVAELATVAERARAQASRTPADAQRVGMADLCEALAWHQASDHGASGEARIVDQVAAERAVAARLAGQGRLAA